MRTPEESYRADPEYHAMVDCMAKWIKNHSTTPSELREMAMFACVVYEQTKPAHTELALCQACRGAGHVPVQIKET